MNSIHGFNPVRHIDIGPSQPLKPTEGKSSDFGNVLQSAIHQVEASSSKASQSVQQFLSGETEDLHTVAMATQRAELQFELVQQMRNKVVQAYQEIMRTQL